MKRFTSFMEVEALCAAMIRDYGRASGREKALCVDIEGFVTEYLGMPVVYETFAEEEPGRIGFCSDGTRPLAVRRRGRTESVVFPARTAVIEKGLLRPGEGARRRFTIAHEGAHDILLRHIPLQSELLAALRGEYDPDAVFTPELVREAVSVREGLTNRAAACLLMPWFSVERVLTRYNGGRKVVVYGEHVLSQGQKLAVQRMADALGVSYSAFRTRLRELGLCEERPVEEYLRRHLRYGGDVRAPGA